MPQVTLSAKIMSGVRGGEVQDAPVASPESAIGPEDWAACDPREIPSEARFAPTPVTTDSAGWLGLPPGPLLWLVRITPPVHVGGMNAWSVIARMARTLLQRPS